jgi:hypothetical protein
MIKIATRATGMLGAQARQTQRSALMLVFALVAALTMSGLEAAAQVTNTMWTINANVDNGTNQCINANFACNGSVTGTIVTALAPDPSAGTPAGATGALPTTLPQIPVVISVNLTVTANYNDTCCVINPVSGVGSATITLSGGSNYFLAGGTGTPSGQPTAYGNSIIALQQPVGSLSSQTTTTNGSATVTILASGSNFTPASLPSNVGSGGTVAIVLTFPTAAWMSQTATVTAIQTEVCGIADYGCSDGADLGSGVTGTVTGQPITCNQIEQNLHDQLQQAGHVGAIGGLIDAFVTAPFGLTMQQAASVCGFNNFDWVSAVQSVPSTLVLILENKALANNPPAQCLTLGINCPLPITGWNDPPQGGYAPDDEDCVNTSSPYYLDPNNNQVCEEFDLISNNGYPNGLVFFDAPYVACPTLLCFNPGQYIDFFTQLVGVLPDSNGNPSQLYDTIGTFSWIDNYSCFGGPPLCVGGAVQNLGSVPPGGTGGAFVTAINGVPTAVSLTSGQSCNGTFDGTFYGTVTISAGQNCTFTNDCQIEGNVTVVDGGSFNLTCAVTGNITDTGGSLVLGPSASVGGNVQISQASALTLGPGAVIGGNLQIQGLPASLSPGTVCGIQIKGNLAAQNNASPIEIGGTTQQGCAGNTVGGNLQVDNNTAAVTVDTNRVGGNLQADSDSATTDVSGNSVNGNLQCQNDNTVTHVALNMVRGKNQGQCAAFP